MAVVEPPFVPPLEGGKAKPGGSMAEETRRLLVRRATVVCRANSARVSPSHKRHLAQPDDEGAVVTVSRRKAKPGRSMAGETRRLLVRRATI